MTSILPNGHAIGQFERAPRDHWRCCEEHVTLGVSFRAGMMRPIAIG
jgi:hypothetical protein